MGWPLREPPHYLREAVVHRSSVFFATLALAIVARPGFAGPRSLSAIDERDCPPVCVSECVKPIVVPDRWDDVNLVPGHEDWVGNQRFDSEPFQDVNENHLYDPGELFTDSNGNATHDEEAYHPTLTGYVPFAVPGNVLAPEGDFGRLITLRPSQESRVVSSHYFAATYPPTNKGTPRRGARAFREALEFCVPGERTEKGDWLELEPGSMAGVTYDALRAMYARDPDAHWDPVAGAVVGSRFDEAHQQRTVLLSLNDPRLGPGPGRALVQVTKVAAFFIESTLASGEVAGRLVRVRAPGLPCGCHCTSDEAFLRHCP